MNHTKRGAPPQPSMRKDNTNKNPSERPVLPGPSKTVLSCVRELQDGSTPTRTITAPPFTSGTEVTETPRGPNGVPAASSRPGCYSDALGRVAKPAPKSKGYSGHPPAFPDTSENSAFSKPEARYHGRFQRPWPIVILPSSNPRVDKPQASTSKTQTRVPTPRHQGWGGGWGTQNLSPGYCSMPRYPRRYRAFAHQRLNTTG